jgi:hypothetical protein
MLQDLDTTLRTMLDDAAAPTELRNADVSFETPDKNFTPGQATINLFLYEVRENRELRDPEPIRRQVGPNIMRRPPPLRVDCTYMVTTWSSLSGAAKIAEEHQLLAQALVWLTRFPTIPAGFLQGGLVAQRFPPPTLVAQMDNNKSAGEFWTALGTSPRPAFSLLVTIALDLDVEVSEGPPVITKEMRLQQIEPATPFDTFFEIAGTIANANTGAPIADAAVTLVELDRETRSDAEGRFRFAGIVAGSYTLRAAATGFTTQNSAVAVPGAAANAYDVDLTP